MINQKEAEREMVKKIKESQAMKDLINTPIFKDSLKILALRINELDTVRNIDPKKDSKDNIAIRQLASLLAIDKIEAWIHEIYAIAEFKDMAERLSLEEDGGLWQKAIKQERE